MWAVSGFWSIETSCSADSLLVATWNIVDVDADWDDESGQVELRIEAQVSCFGSNQSASIDGFAFHVTILAALPAGLYLISSQQKSPAPMLRRDFCSEMRVSEYF